jgi:hypothetical protein
MQFRIRELPSAARAKPEVTMCATMTFPGIKLAFFFLRKAGIHSWPQEIEINNTKSLSILAA